MATIDLREAPPPEKYRYYVCELKWNAWECTRNEFPFEKHELSRGAFVSQLIPINKHIPKFFDPILLSYKTKKPVVLKSW